MNEQAKEELLKRYLDGELSDKEEQKVLHLIADDADMRSMLRFERMLQQSTGDLSSFDVPEHFADGVMNRIGQVESTAPEASGSVFDGLKRFWEQMWTPRQLQLRPAIGVAMAVVVVSVFVWSSLNIGNRSSSQAVSEGKGSRLANFESVQPVSAENNRVMVRFVFIDSNARSISVAGDFSNWKPIDLSREQVNGKEVWTGLVSMIRGEHHYMFVKNGKKWITDPLAPIHQDDGFGNKNAVIYL